MSWIQSWKRLQALLSKLTFGPNLYFWNSVRSLGFNYLPWPLSITGNAAANNSSLSNESSATNILMMCLRAQHVKVPLTFIPFFCSINGLCRITEQTTDSRRHMFTDKSGLCLARFDTPLPIDNLNASLIQRLSHCLILRLFLVPIGGIDHFARIEPLENTKVFQIRGSNPKSACRVGILEHWQ